VPAQRLSAPGQQHRQPGRRSPPASSGCPSLCNRKALLPVVSRDATQALLAFLPTSCHDTHGCPPPCSILKPGYSHARCLNICCDTLTQQNHVPARLPGSTLPPSFHAASDQRQLRGPATHHAGRCCRCRRC
jgi:hypothetical protein